MFHTLKYPQSSYLFLVVWLAACEGNTVTSTPNGDASVETLDSKEDSTQILDAGEDSLHDSSADSLAIDSALDTRVDSTPEAQTDSLAETADSTLDSTLDSTFDAVNDANGVNDVTKDVGDTADVADAIPVWEKMGTGPCGNQRYVSMAMTKLAAGFCIDHAEVTRFEYGIFLQDPNRLKSLPDYCVGVSLGSVNGNTEPDKPVVNVNWCAATAYCKWAGKRLCGQIKLNSTTLPNSDPINYNQIALNQWYSACTCDNSSNSYPYGSAYNAGICNDSTSGVKDVGAMSQCHSSDALCKNVYDLAGNAAEWEDSCESYPPKATTKCRVRGGSYSNGSNAACTRDELLMRDSFFGSVGIRCCKDGI